MKIQPAKRLRGSVRLPGDKSISHRAALLAALAEPGGYTRIGNYATSADCASTLNCLQQLGVGIERAADAVIISGVGTSLPPPRRAATAPLDCGNSGTTMRLLAGILAGQTFAATLTGDGSLRTRPMRRVIEPLELMGARVASDDAGRAPLCIEGRRPLTAISYAPEVASAQVKSCVLLAGLNADGRTEVVERDAPTRDHTERMLRWFGVDVRQQTRAGDDDGNRSAHVVSLAGGSRLTARDLVVPGDISAAAFFLIAATLLPSSDLTLEGVGLNPTRAGLLDTLRALGAKVEATAQRMQGNEEVGDLRARGAASAGDRLVPAVAGANVVRGARIAGLIDELPILAVAGSQIEGGLEVRDAAELRVKETDRIQATVVNLRAMGAEVEEYADGFHIAGKARLRGARLDARGDHRIAMAFSVAALLAEGDSEIVGAECVAVSFPEFFRVLASVAER